MDSKDYYRLCDPDSGAVYLFDPDSGFCVKMTTAGGQETINTLSEDGSRIVSTVRTLTYTECGVDHTTTESWNYGVYTDDPFTNLLQYVTHSRTVDAVTTLIRRLVMTYYQSGDADGSAGDLQTISVQVFDGLNWATISTEMFRFYTANPSGGLSNPPGYAYGLKFVVGPEAYARIAAVADPLTAPDDLVAQFADVYYQYVPGAYSSEPRRVTQSVTAGGTLPHEFAYVEAPPSFGAGYNIWALECIATHADGSQKISFSNYVCNVFLSDFWDTQGHESYGRWINHILLDPTTGRPLKVYSPAAIDMSGYHGPAYDPAVATLNVQLNPSVGLVDVSEYTSVTAGGKTFYGYLATTKVQQGSTGLATTVRAYDYTAQTAGTETTTSWLVYRNTKLEYPNGTGIETDFEYTFYTIGGNATVQVETKTTKPPIVPSDQNGDDIQYFIVETRDVQNRVYNLTDPYDSASVPDPIPSVTTIYDEPTGAVARRIRNVNPDGGDPTIYNLATDYTLDAQARAVITLGPWFNANGQQVRSATFSAFLDAQREVRTATGFATAAGDSSYEFTLVNPVSITKLDYSGHAIEQISAIRQGSPRGPREASSPGSPLPAPSSLPYSPGLLTAGDLFPQSSYVRWTTNIYNNAADLTATRVYHDIPAVGPGNPGEHYDETSFGEDQMNRPNMTRSPGGTITRLVHDVRDNVVETYVGTNDAGATDEQPDGYNVPGNNMVKTATSIFDNGNPIGGNDLLTTAVEHVDSNPDNDRRTDFAHDFRNRNYLTTAFISTTGTPVSVVTLKTFDNLDGVTAVAQYNTTVGTGHLIRSSATLLDNLRRAYQTQVNGVSGGATTGITLYGNTWFNALGQPVKQAPLGGSLVYTKTAYDVVNRPIGSYTGYAPDGDTHPWEITDEDKIFVQTLTILDGAGNATQIANFQRNNADTSTNVLTTDHARATYAGFWQDGAGRQIAAANYGTNGGTAPTPPLAAPAGSDSVLVSQIAYNAWGEGFQTIDPAGMVNVAITDDAGRQVAMVQNYQAEGLGDGGQGLGPCSGSASVLPLPLRERAGVRGVVPTPPPAPTSTSPHSRVTPRMAASPNSLPSTPSPATSARATSTARHCPIRPLHRAETCWQWTCWPAIRAQTTSPAATCSSR